VDLLASVSNSQTMLGKILLLKLKYSIFSPESECTELSFLFRFK